MTDPLAQARRDLVRASGNIFDFGLRQEAYIRGGAFQVVEEPREGGGYIAKVKRVREPPVDLEEAAADAIMRLREALEHACAGLAALKFDRLNKCQFPFVDEPSHFDRQFLKDGKSKQIPIEVRPFLKSLNANASGDRLLYALNKMRASRYHGLVDVVGAVADQLTVYHMVLHGDVQVGRPWDYEKHESVIAEVAQGSVFNAHLGLSGTAVFGPKAHLAREPIKPVLDAMLVRVTEVVEGLDREARRTGLI